MFRCRKCKGWLKIGKIYIYDIVKQNAFNYALEKGSTNIDYDEYEAEASASQLIL